MELTDAAVARLEEAESRFEQIELELADPGVSAQPDKLKTLGMEHSVLKETVERWRAYKASQSDLDEAKKMLKGASGDERSYVEDEIKTHRDALEQLGAELIQALEPKDPNDERDVIVEIRAGAGGDEAGLFAAELMRMFTRYAEGRRWKVEMLTMNETGVNGFKEVTFAVKGKGAWARLKHEAGVHRVQRVPVTESGGRIHTSTVSVVVLPEAEEVDVHIDANDLKIDVYRSSGPGGQSVNTTDSAVRITHVPTGEVVAVQDEKSQLQNKEKALRILRARLLQVEQDKQMAAASEERRAQVGTGDRSEKIRTYNFPDNRVTDHRIGYTTHRLPEVLDGDLDEIIDNLIAASREKALEEGDS